MEQSPETLEVLVTQELCDKIAIQALRNGNKNTLTHNNKSIALDLNGHKILQQLHMYSKLLVSLNLSHCNLISFPTLFDESSHLKQLNLSHNNLTEVPKIIFTTLHLLEQIDLSHNKIKSFNAIPKCILSLQILRLNNNCLENLPEFILNMHCLNLEEFYYSYNHITDISSSRFLYGGPYRLKKIELKNSFVRSQDLKYLKNIRTLQECDLSNDGDRNRNCIEFANGLDTFFQNAMWENRLCVLKLIELSISDIPANICQLFNLQELYLAKNQLMWLPNSIGLLIKLKVLDVSENSLFSLPKDIIKLQKLEILQASSNNISEVPDLSCLTVTYLDLYDNCLDNCCLINWDFVGMIDLEYNYFNTRDVLLQKYTEKKTALRQQLKVERKNNSKEVQCDNDIDDVFARYTSDEESCVSGSDGEFRPGYIEECWSTSSEECTNGCTTSDNEWTGSEQTVVKCKTIKRRILHPPSWMFEDVE